MATSNITSDYEQFAVPIDGLVPSNPNLMSASNGVDIEIGYPPELCLG